ncbi:lipid droplet-associated hydrolase isoform X2 [Oryzias melastigma]|uniref:Lipid droplet-associated hydrolase n=1 Tax=Oryzias melastigma TaxID=30732 RepID=A0A3B3D6K4_ORYME|nr:lipid droplet-associated hydrolase isoform X2 [Oryzias melastigma]
MTINDPRQLDYPIHNDYKAAGMEPHTDFTFCCGALTEVLKFGPRQLLPEHKLVILLIPGNPGLVGFYKTFMQELHSLLEHKYPVWAVSHAGHCAAPDGMDMVEDGRAAAEDDVFGLSGQIEHKLAFVRKHIPKGSSLVLVGHSIGCYIILEMMRRNPELKVLKAVMLFPTIERMAESPQGRRLTPLLCQMRYLAYLPVFLVSLLPDILKAALIKLVLSCISSLDRCILQPTVQLLSGDCAANSMYLGGQEMRMVLGRDNITIKKNLDKLIFYYGATDHWCPVKYFYDIKRDIPDGDFRLCKKGFRHAFVLDVGREVAEMVAEWIYGALRT